MAKALDRLTETLLPQGDESGPFAFESVTLRRLHPRYNLA